jgi:hypothetical protein
MIRRFFQDGQRPVEIIERDLSLAEAQAHCNDPSTRGGDSEKGTAWFDGYDVDPDADDGEDDVALVDEAHHVRPTYEERSLGEWIEDQS